jgi:hypothetical protein
MHQWINRASMILLGLGLVAGSVVGIWRAADDLPRICDPPPPLHLHSNSNDTNWFGQGAGAAFGLGVLLVLLLYAGKWGITWFTSNAPARIFWYCLGVACSLPYIWYLVVVDWRNPFAFRVSCWVYYPIGIWLVPMGSFAWDVVTRTHCTPQDYLARSVLEMIVIYPLWLYFWVFSSFFFLGGGWI